MMTILVVDDRTANRELLNIVLSREGFRVCEASDGIEALRLLDQEPVNAIISDVLMPNMDGYMLCMEVRDRPRYNALPFIIYTSSFTSSNDEALAMELGADKFIRKPASGEMLVGAVRQLLSGPALAHVPVAPRTDLSLTNKYARHLVNKLTDKNEELQQRTQELREASAKFQAVIQSAPIGIVAFDSEGKIRTWNPAMARIFGWSETEVLGQRPPYRSDEDEAEIEGISRRALTGETITGLEVRRRRRDGTQINLEASYTTLHDTNGEIAGEIALVVDITERKRTEESLRLLGYAVEQSKESIMITDTELDPPGPRILFVNAAFTMMTGYTAEETIGRNPRFLQGPRTDRTALSRLRQNLERGEAFAGEGINYRKDGTEFHLEWQIAPIRDAGGKATHYVSIQRDVTERKVADEVLRASEERFRQLAENLHEVVWIRKVGSRRLEFTSAAYEKIWRRSLADLDRRPEAWREAIHPDDRERITREAELALVSGEFNQSYRIVWPDGSIRWIRGRTFPIRDGHGTVVRIAGVAEDITERKHSEQQQENWRVALQTLTNRLFGVQEEDRRHLARELHDEIGQNLTAAKLEIEAARKLGNLAAVTLHLDDSLAVIERLLTSVRTLSLDLRPALLDEVGLAAAVRGHARSHGERGGLAVQLAVEDPLPRGNPSIEIACFRVMQEALTNVLRHARARAVEIRLHCEGDELHLLVRDDGIGFDVAEAEARVASGQTFGLLSMRERVGLAGGRFVCESTAAQGTRIEVALPINVS